MPRPGVDVHPEVYEEVEESRRWYEEHPEGLGLDFLKEVSKGIETIRSAPTIWPWQDREAAGTPLPIAVP